MDKVFQIFKAGKHTAMNGKVLEFSDSALKLAADSYPPPGGRLAPLTLGHPDNDQPILGQVKRLFFKDGGLYAHADVFGPLVSAVREGRYKNVSASFFFPSHPQNPAPGAYGLKHVGFLGAIPPAVRGMEQPAFSESGGGAICFSEGCDLADCAQEAVAACPVPAGWSIDPEAASLYALADEYRRGCPALTFSEAAQFAAAHY
jgi:hypothetical protein